MNGPWRITFDTNPDDCNRACVMCEQHSRYRPRGETPHTRRRMPVELIRRVVAECAPLGLREIIPSTMGEPLLYDHFEDILAICREHRVRLNLTTNGSFPGRGAEAWAQALVPVTSDVKISWNGSTAATQERVMVGSRFDQGLADIRAFASVRDAHVAQGGHRCTMTLQLTFLEWNLAELPDIVRLAASLGIDRVKGHHVWAHFPPLPELSMRRSAQSIDRWNEVALETQRVAQQLDVRLDNVHILEADAVEDLDPEATCPFLDAEAWVAWDGRFHPCCAPDEQRRSLGDFSLLGEQGLMDIWRSEAYRRLVASYRDHALCRRCNMRRRA